MNATTRRKALIFAGLISYISCFAIWWAKRPASVVQAGKETDAAVAKLETVIKSQDKAVERIVTAESAEIEYIPRGWTSQDSGYYMTEQAGRDILEGWRSDRVAKGVYKVALDELYNEWQTFKGDMQAQISEVRAAHTKERQEWQRELRRARAPGFGVFGGVGYTTNRDVQGVVGVGLVWKVF